MTLNGKLLVEGRIVRESTSEDNDSEHSFRDKLEACLWSFVLLLRYRSLFG